MEELLSYSENLILEQSEKDVIEQAKKDLRKFKPLYDKYYKRIFLFLLNRHGDPQETADVISQVFLNALTNLNQFTYKGHPFSSWLYRIAINESNKVFIKKSKRRLVSLDEAISERLTEQIFLSEDDQQLKLSQALQTLRPEELQLIELRFFESLSFKEVGEILEVTENNAKVKLYRVLDKLRAKMKK